jgi:hypothetical protein
MRRALDDRGIGSCARRMEASKSRVSHDRPESVGSTGDALTSTRPAETTVDLHSPLNLCLLYWLYWLFPAIIDAAAVVRLSPRHCCDDIAGAGEASVALGRKPGGTGGPRLHQAHFQSRPRCAGGPARRRQRPPAAFLPSERRPASTLQDGESVDARTTR